MFDVIIVGSGAAGVAAALGFVDGGIRPLILDVGIRNEDGPRAEGNFYEYRSRNDSFDVMIGPTFRGLANLLTTDARPVKLTAPNAEYVTRDAGRLGPLEESGFDAIQSFAAGGLANAWGAGLYPFVDEDLKEFPIDAADLAPHVARLTGEIGISGADDDLSRFFGDPKGLLPALRLSHNMSRIHSRYRKKREALRRRGIFLGRPRIAVLTREHDGRPALQYTNTEFWQDSPAIYSPRITLDKLCANGSVEYRKNTLVTSWSETSGHVRVEGRDAKIGDPLAFDCRALVLAAGAINTSKIVLNAFRDHRTELRLLENPALQIPLVLPGSIGRALDVEAFGLVQLNLVWDSASLGTRLQGSIMELTSPMRAEFFGSLPYAARSNLALLRDLLPAVFVMQLFYPGPDTEPALLSLSDNGRVRIVGRSIGPDPTGISELLSGLRRLGVWTHRSLIVRAPLGHSIHYAGTLPMREDPGPYECDRSGRLHGTDSVYVADSASFTALPAKNMSMGMMANAMRIAEGVAGRHGHTA